MARAFGSNAADRLRHYRIGNMVLGADGSGSFDAEALRKLIAPRRWRNSDSGDSRAVEMRAGTAARRRTVYSLTQCACR